MNDKELNEDEIQNYIFSDSKNEIITFIKIKKKTNTQYYIKVVYINQLIQCSIFQKYFFHMS